MDVLKYNDFIAEGAIDIGRCDLGKRHVLPS
jgi:hypothetical protein